MTNYSEIKIKRGAEDPHAEFTPDSGQLVFDVDNTRTTVGDDVNTAGVDTLKGNRADQDKSTIYGSNNEGQRGFTQYPATVTITPNMVDVHGTASTGVTDHLLPYIDHMTDSTSDPSYDPTEYVVTNSATTKPLPIQNPYLYIISWSPTVTIGTGTAEHPESVVGTDAPMIEMLDGWSKTSLSSFSVLDIIDTDTGLTPPEDLRYIIGIEWDNTYLYLSTRSIVYRLDGFDADNPNIVSGGKLVLGNDVDIVDICWDRTDLYIAELGSISKYSGYSSTLVRKLTGDNYTQMSIDGIVGITCDADYIYFKLFYNADFLKIPKTAFTDAVPPVDVEAEVCGTLAQTVYSNIWVNIPRGCTYDGNNFYIAKTILFWKRYMTSVLCWTPITWSEWDLVIAEESKNYHREKRIDWERYDSAIIYTGVNKTEGYYVYPDEQSNSWSYKPYSNSYDITIKNLVWGDYYTRMGLDPYEEPEPEPPPTSDPPIVGPTPIPWVDPVVVPVSQPPKVIDGIGWCFFNTTFLPQWDPDKDVNMKITYTCNNSLGGNNAVYYTYIWDLTNGSTPTTTSYDANYTDYIKSVNSFGVTSTVLTNAVIPHSLDAPHDIRIEMLRDSTGDEYNGHILIHKIDLYQAKAGAEYGYYCGGDDAVSATPSPISTIDRMHFPFNNANTVVTGNISNETINSGACNSSINGYVMGGKLNDAASISTVDKLIFPLNSGNAVNVGNLTTTDHAFAACNSSSHGYTMGGANSFITGSEDPNDIKKINFSIDTSISTSISGDLIGDFRYARNGGANSSTFGYSIGSFSDVYNMSAQRVIQRFNFAAGGNTIDVGELSAINDHGKQEGVFNPASFNSSNYGYVAGGNGLSTIDRVDFSLSTAADSISICNLAMNDSDSSGTSGSIGCNSTVHGFIMGGGNSAYDLYYSTIDRIDFAADGVSTSCDGTLSQAQRNAGCGLDGVDFVSMFI